MQKLLRKYFINGFLGCENSFDKCSIVDVQFKRLYGAQNFFGLRNLLQLRSFHIFLSFGKMKSGNSKQQTESGSQRVENSKMDLIPKDLNNILLHGLCNLRTDQLTTRAHLQCISYSQPGLI